MKQASTPSHRRSASGSMRLSEFIEANRERILEEWEAFASTRAPASDTMDLEALRDHASQILAGIVEDLETPQDEEKRARKSKGGTDADPAVSSAAQQHGADRALAGFTPEQTVSEYRALRASVIRLWTEAEGGLESADAQLTRFNEAIDQSLALSMERFMEDLNQSKDMFLGILGHDLRAPLGAISTSAQFMIETGELDEPHHTLASRIVTSSARMEQMVGDLLDFTRSRLGGGIPIERVRGSMETLVRDAVDEVKARYPEQTIHVETGAQQHDGEWDPARVSQMLSNLIGNAAEHAPEGTTVGVELGGDDEEIALTIHNRGPVIPPGELPRIFDPMKSAKVGNTSRAGPTASLGLGLYIADRIVRVHDGRIDVESSEAQGTTFTVRLPRHG